MVTNDQVMVHEGLVVQIAKTLSGCGVDQDDLKQAGMLGLTLAIERYDPTQGSFSTFAYHYIRGYMLREVHNEDRYGCPNFGEDENGRRCEDSIAAKDETETEIVDILDTVLPVLTKREREVIAMRYGLDGYSSMTMPEIAEKLGVTKQRIKQIEDGAMERMRAKIG